MTGECDKCSEHPIDCACGYTQRKREKKTKLETLKELGLLGGINAVYKPEWGFHNLMVLAAFRYCLGRRTYIVGSCVDWLIQYWDEIDQNTKRIILQETKECLDRKEAGDACDVVRWQQLVSHGMDQR